MRTRMIAAVGALLLAVVPLAAPAILFAQVGISVAIAPPGLPVYDQPVCPGNGYIWTPGYWAWADTDYYWVPGAWVEAPEPGFLWTPGYWGWGGSGFMFHEGYWGSEVGFYGGIDYGYGYSGQGFDGGRWDNGHFFYNRSVSNVDGTVIHNVYTTRVVNNTVTHVSYNGGNGGTNARPTPQEETAARGRHIPAVAAQSEQAEAARANPQSRTSVNHGQPAHEAAAPHTAAAAPGTKTAIHPNDLPPIEHPTPPNTGNPKLDQRYQQQQDKLVAQQSQERQKLQQKQDQDHQQLAQQKTDAAGQQKLEQQHQHQTQQLAQKHTQQQHVLMTRQQPTHQNQPDSPKGKT